MRSLQRHIIYENSAPENKKMFLSTRRIALKSQTSRLLRSACLHVGPVVVPHSADCATQHFMTSEIKQGLATYQKRAKKHLIRSEHVNSRQVMRCKFRIPVRFRWPSSRPSSHQIRANGYSVTFPSTPNPAFPRSRYFNFLSGQESR